MPNIARIIDEPEIGKTEKIPSKALVDKIDAPFIEHINSKKAYIKNFIDINIGVLLSISMFILFSGVEIRSLSLTMLNSDIIYDNTRSFFSDLLPYTVIICVITGVFTIVSAIAYMRDVVSILIGFFIMKIPTMLGAMLLTWGMTNFFLDGLKNACADEHWQPSHNCSEIWTEMVILMGICFVILLLCVNFGIIQLWFLGIEEERPPKTVVYAPISNPEPPRILNNIIE